MKRAILLHGMSSKSEYFRDVFPSLSNSHWFPWLQKQLLMQNIITQTPEMPEPYRPDYNRWKNEFEQLHVNELASLVGHSCGGGFFVRWLSENAITIDKLILVAPWLDPARKETTAFFDFSINPKLQKRVKEIHIFVSNDDETHGIEESVQMIIKAIPSSIIHRFIDKGHFTHNDMESHKFPELLEVLISHSDEHS